MAEAKKKVIYTDLRQLSIQTDLESGWSKIPLPSQVTLGKEAYFFKSSVSLSVKWG